MQDSSLPDVSNAGSGRNRDVVAVYDAVIDQTAKTFILTPVERDIQYHFPLTQLYPNVLQITEYGWLPNFWADILLKHPTPGMEIDGFDPRVIAIIPANPGVSFSYPTLDVNANNSVVLEPDGYTRLYDNLGGSIPGNANPFKAYFKDQPYRVWSGTGVTEETQRWQMKLTGFGGPLQYKLVVDVSSNYPNPPQPRVDNAPEPVKIDAKVCRGLTSGGGLAYISVTLLDWQGQSGIGGVQVEAPDIFDSIVSLAYSGQGTNPNEYVYSGTITNSQLAPEGEYRILITTWDQVTDFHMYNEFTAVVSDDGNLVWAKGAGGSGFDFGNSITAISDNSTVLTGPFVGTATFGTGEINETVLTSAGGSDIFIARYNPDGTLLWAKRAGGSNYDYGSGITTLSDNSTVVTGYFQKSAIFGQDEINQKTLNSAGDYDIFIAHYNTDGTLAWAKRAGGVDFDDGIAVTTLSDNSTVVTGHFEVSCTFGSGESNRTVLTSTGDSDIFIAHYNPNGTLAWAKRAGGTDADYGYAITSLSDNSTVITGEFWGSATFGSSEANQTVLDSIGLSDIFIAQYNSDGTLAWAKRAGGSEADYGRGITALSDNTTVATGYFRGSPTFGSGESNQTMLKSAGNEDLFIARYNSDGTLSWAKRAGGKGLYGDHSFGIAVLSDDSTVITGDFYEKTTFGPDEENETVLISSTGNKDIFVARYNPDGTLAWAKHAGGLSYDYAYAITTLSDNSTVATGSFEGTATFGPGELFQTILTPFGSWDIFVARFEP